MELICPSCEARYQVPELAIGDKGRQVSCLNCGHSWHAFPPLVLKSPAASQKAVPRWQATETEQTPEAPPAPSAPPAPPATEWTEPATAEGIETFSPPPAAATRSDQLAEIREMLAEVQSEDRAAAALKPDAPLTADNKTRLTPATAAAAGALAASVETKERRAPEPKTISDQDEVATEKAIRDKLNIADVRKMAPKPTDPKRLRRAHDRKETRRKRREAAGSGAFLTGFLVVVMMAAAMVALYLLAPQIIQRMPGSEAALTEYVATIDGWRVGIAETFDNLRGWVVRRFGENT